MKTEKFKPKRGQIDFTNVRYAPVINCVLFYKGKILLVQRNDNLNFYPGYWNGVSGFLDDDKSVKEKVYEELREELKMPKTKVSGMVLGRIFHQEEKEYKKTWIVHPVFVRTKTDEVKIDREAKNFIWLTISEAKKLKLLPGFDTVLKEISTLLSKS